MVAIAYWNGKRAAYGASARLLFLAATFIPAIVLSYPLLVWPLLEGAKPSDLADLMPAAPSTDSSPLNRIFFIPAFLISALATLVALRHRASASASDGRVLRRATIGLRHPVIITLAAFLAWMLATTAWSQDQSVTLRRCALQIMIIASIMLPVLICDRLDRLMRAIAALAVLTIVFNLHAVLTVAPGPIGHEGIYPHKNYLGGIMLIAIMICLYAATCERGLARLAVLAAIPLALFCLKESLSKTSLILAVAAPVVGLAIAGLSRLLRVSPVVTILSGILALYLIFELGAQSRMWSFSSLAQLFFGDPTLTQRTTIWDFSLKVIPDRPLLGFGYDAFWGLDYEAPSYREAPGFVKKMPHAHNGYIDIILQGGFVALALFIPLLLTALHTAGRVVDRHFATGWFVTTVLFLVLIYNCLETSWFRGFDALSMLLVLVLALGITTEARRR